MFLKAFQILKMNAYENVAKFSDRFKLIVERAGPPVKASTLICDRFLQCLPRATSLAIAAQACSVSSLDESIQLARGVNTMMLHSFQ